MSTNASSTAEQEKLEKRETPLDSDEPHTPIWFTFLGVGLFLLGGIFMLISSGDEQEVPGAGAPDVAAAAPTDAGDAEAAPADAGADPHAGHDHD